MCQWLPLYELGPIFAALDAERTTFASVVSDLDRLATAGADETRPLEEYRRAKTATIRLQSELAQAEPAGDPAGLQERLRLYRGGLPYRLGRPGRASGQG